MKMKRYAIKCDDPNDSEGLRSLYWTSIYSGVCWCAELPAERNLLTAAEADKELAWLVSRSPYKADYMVVFDVVDAKERAAIYGPAFRAAIQGVVRTPETLTAAREAGNRALLAAGYAVEQDAAA